MGTDSHTTMINGLGVLGWGVGGIEAEAAMLGQPIAMLIPEVIGFKISGKLREGITATDLVLTVTEMLRRRGVVGKFVEFFGDGLADLTLADRATIANMAPEYGATCGFFPIDERTTEYMELSGRDEDTIALVEAYCKAQGLWRSSADPDPEFTDVLELDLGDVVPSLAGPKRPQDRVPLTAVKRTFIDVVTETLKLNDDEISTLEGEGGQTAVGNHEPSGGQVPVVIDGQKHFMSHGDVVIAAITSCTNTSNPSVMLAAGLVAKKAAEKGMNRKPWVKTSLAPGSKVVTDYLDVTGLQKPLNDIGFDLVGYGCTTCIGNSGPLPPEIDKAISDGDLVVASVLSGNRNFEGRVHQSVRTNWLASPPLVVAYALAGTVKIDLDSDPLGKDKDGKPRPGRRHGECVTDWRFLVLESDHAPEELWLKALVQLGFPIVAVFTSGRRSVHALVRVDCKTKSDFDALRDDLVQVLAPLGADAAAMTAVRLSRLPGLYRHGAKDKDGKLQRYQKPRLQKLLWLNPEAKAEPILNIAKH